MTRDEVAAILTYEDGVPTIRNLTPDALDYVTEWMRVWHKAMWPRARRGRP